MNWKKILINIGAFGATSFMGALELGASTKQAALITLGAIVSNLGGLFQEKPKVN